MEQMALQELEEDHNQLVAAIKKDEANLMDFRSLFNHRSSELILLKDRGLYRSQQIFQDWENLFPPGNSLITARELNFFRRGSETIEQPFKVLPFIILQKTRVILRKT